MNFKADFSEDRRLQLGFVFITVFESVGYNLVWSRYSIENITVLWRLCLQNYKFKMFLFKQKFVNLFLWINYIWPYITNFNFVQFELVVYSHIYPLIKPYISINQHGFMEKRSTTSNLLCMSQFLAAQLDNQCQVDVIYTDISKAFDSVDHNILLNKLLEFGLSMSLVLFLNLT